jgi:hypothetical protein
MFPISTMYSSIWLAMTSMRTPVEAQNHRTITACVNRAVVENDGSKLGFWNKNAEIGLQLDSQSSTSMCDFFSNEGLARSCIFFICLWVFSNKIIDKQVELFWRAMHHLNFCQLFQQCVTFFKKKTYRYVH